MQTTSNETTAKRIARHMPTSTLRHIASTLERELIADCDRGVRGTQAHIGKVELMNACSEIVAERIEQFITG